MQTNPEISPDAKYIARRITLHMWIIVLIPVTIWLFDKIMTRITGVGF